MHRKDIVYVKMGGYLWAWGSLPKIGCMYQTSLPELVI